MTRRKMIEWLICQGVTTIREKVLDECYTFELRHAVGCSISNQHLIKDHPPVFRSARRQPFVSF